MEIGVDDGRFDGFTGGMGSGMLFHLAGGLRGRLQEDEAGAAQ